MTPKRVLIVEDDADGASILEAYLKRDGFEVDIAEDGARGLALFRQRTPAIVLLDMMLPKMSGPELLTEIRRSADTPVIMVTAIGDEPDKIGALRYGADDYVVKPCNPKEVVARVHAVLRRYAAPAGNRQRLECQGVWVDAERFVAGVRTCDGEEQVLDLTRSELLLLAALLRTPTKAFSREELLELCMPESDALVRIIDTHVHNLRRKLEALGISGVLVTVRSVGYRFR
ncbi:response regulator [Pseudomonas mosselii]|uniref:response regulator transcription factor n=1 Tax=Pseudomonas mosselii TaxID=78327 RepID=UPI00077018F4|nr:response regulator transcription factor [Pseudomonas mosselii]AMK31776.1 DNA-binding response regulator [Pseudomonas putida]KXG83577.1 two-component system response regulator [Pseudomonas mosselii]MDH1657612.1 response regulator [Pseudomonas mosselii]MDH1715619.1 response regulator [Pseudomonas mosselii]MDH1720527.1 response regulator [Pseudomonas mosselii]